MAVPRIKTFSNGGTILPSDLNSIEDDYGSRFDAVYVAGGFNADTVVRRGKSIIATSEVRANAAYGLLTTPDRVQNVVLPTDGMIAVMYQATWSEQNSGQGRAAIFIGANQLKVADNNGTAPAAALQETGSAVSSSGAEGPLVTASWGLVGGKSQNAGYVDVTTGQALGMTDSAANNTMAWIVGGASQTPAAGAMGVGGPCYIFAAAGTYDVSIQYKTALGNLTVKNRKLWVWTINF